MAVVTLKDLMDPLTKIQAATESSAESIGAMSMAINSLAAKKPPGVTLVEKLLLVNSNKQTKLLEQIAKNSGSSDSDSPSSPASKDNKNNSGSSGSDSVSSGGPKDNKGAADGAQALKALGIGAQTLATGLLIFNFVPKKAISKFKEALFDLYEILSNIDGKNIKEGAEAFQVMASSIGTFAKNLALSAILLPIGLIGVSLLKTVLKLITPAFIKLGEESKEINKGAESLHLMGTSLLSFAKGLVIASLAAIVGIIGIPFLLVSMVLIGGAMALLGKLSKPITKGAKALDKMGDGLKSFGVGLAVFALATFFIMMDPNLVKQMAMTLIIVGGVVALLGVVNKQIIKGSLALALMGIGLVVFGIGYAIFAGAIATAAPTLEDIAMQAGVLIGLGIAVALLGVGLSLIAQGALSLALIGIGLLVFGLGYSPFVEATKDASLGSIAVQAGVLTSLGLVFAAAGLGALFIIPGAAAFAAIGGALMLLAPGLGAMKSLNFTEKDALNLTTTLAGVKTAFIGPPSKGGISGIFSSIGGAISGTVDAGAMTAASVGFAAAGIALTKLSVGLKAYKALDWNEDDSLQLTTVLTGVTTAFAAAGGESATPTGIFGAVFGNAFSPNATEKGIDSVMGAGKALTSIATGLIAFSGLAGKIDMVTFAEDIGTVVGSVSKAFGIIGGSDQNVESGGFFSGLLGIKSTATEEGIRSVMDAGSALTGIADGLIAFSGLAAKIDIKLLAKDISDVVGSVSKAFGIIGGSDQNVESGGFFSGLLGIKSTATEEGIRSVNGAGDALTDIAKALESFQGLTDAKATAEKIGDVLGIVGGAFAVIGGAEPADGTAAAIQWDTDAIEDGIEYVTETAEALTDIAAGLTGFTDIQPEAVATSISTLLTSIGTAFSNLYTTRPEVSKELADFATFIVTLGDVAEKGLLDKAADGISKIADSINKIDIDKTVAFGELFKSSSKLSEDSAAYEALATAVSDIRDMMQSSGGGGSSEPGKIVADVSTITGGDTPAANQTEGSGNQAAANQTDGSAKQFKALNITLSQLSSAIAKLPTDIAMIELQVSPPA